jgi:hypothetical protein
VEESIKMEEVEGKKGKTNLCLSVPAGLVRQAKAEHVNLSALLTTVLERGLETQDSEQKTIPDVLFRQYVKYRQNVNHYTTQYGILWLQGGKYEHFGNTREIIAYLEGRYNDEIVSRQNRLYEICTRGGTDEEKLEELYELYKQVFELSSDPRIKENWLRYRMRVWRIHGSYRTMRRTLDERLEKDSEAVVTYQPPDQTEFLMSTED